MALIQKKANLSPIKATPEFFSDFLTNLNVTNVKKDLTRAVNEEAVKTSIRNLLLTNRGDRFFRNTIGSDLRSMLFELSSPANEQMIADLIRTTIDNYEPRASIVDVRVESDDDNNMVIATIVFNIINKEEPIVLDLILNRIR